MRNVFAINSIKLSIVTQENLLNKSKAYLRFLLKAAHSICGYSAFLGACFPRYHLRFLLFVVLVLFVLLVTLTATFSSSGLSEIILMIKGHEYPTTVLYTSICAPVRSQAHGARITL